MPQNLGHWNVGDVILDLYKVTDILGEGGFGKVYKVRHEGWNIDLAVKIPKPEIIAAAGGLENFEREAETWVNLGLHPHIVYCHYVRRIDKSPIVFAEYVAGGSLHDWIESHKLYEGGKEASLKRILDIAIQFAWGLHYAHEQGLIHQDVKPGNVMITPQCVVKVTDFGLANVGTTSAIANNHKGTPRASKVSDSTLIVPGSGVMTPAYCSPEQANGDKLTRRTDLWSWALSILEMFQGERTWTHGSVGAEVLEAYLKTGSEYFHLPQMPISLAQLLGGCFCENQNERPHNMLKVASELQSIYQHLTGEAYLKQQPQISQDSAVNLNNRAVSLFDLGREPEALHLWERALKSLAHHPESTYNRGLILWRAGRINGDTLVRDMEKVRQSYPWKWVVNYLLGLVHLEHDDCSTAIKILEKICQERTQKQEVQKALALAQERLSKSRQLLHTLKFWTINHQMPHHLAPMVLSKISSIYRENIDHYSEIESPLVKERIIFLGTVIDDDIADDIIDKLLFFNAEDPEKDIYFYINAPGGSVSAGMSIYETMQKIQPDVVTVCSGLAKGMAALLLSAGTKGKRMALPDSSIMINKPVAGYQAAEIETQARELAYWRRKIAETLAIHTGQLVEKIYQDAEYDYFMSSLEAQEYGIIDTVLDRSQLPTN